MKRFHIGLPTAELVRFLDTFCHTMDLGNSSPTICPQRMTIYMSDRRRDIRDDPFSCAHFDILPLLKMRSKVSSLTCSFALRIAAISMRSAEDFEVGYMSHPIRSRVNGITTLIDFDMTEWMNLVRSEKLLEVLVWPYGDTKRIYVELVFHQEPSGCQSDVATTLWYLQNVFSNTTDLYLICTFKPQAPLQNH